MPLMIYRLLRDAVEKYGRPVTTEELIEYTRSVIPMCADHVAHHLPLLKRYNLVQSRIDREKKAIFWEPTKPYRSEVELAKQYPELMLDSLYYHMVSEQILGRPIPLHYVIEILYEISGGSEQRPTLFYIKKVIQKAKEKCPELFDRMLKDIENGVPPAESEALSEIKQVIREVRQEIGT